MARKPREPAKLETQRGRCSLGWTNCNPDRDTEVHRTQYCTAWMCFNCVMKAGDEDVHRLLVEQSKKDGAVVYDRWG
jgi:hypothetical protein